MATEIRLPEVGENIESGQVVKLMVSQGDTVEKGQSVLELETDKAVIEVPSSLSGTVSKVRVKEGDEIKVGQVILEVEAAGEEAAKAEPEPQPEAEMEEEPAEAKPSPEDAAPAEPEPAEAGAGRDGREVAPAPEAQPEAPRELAPVSPSVRRLARELGVDINQVAGSGPGGRISTDDVKNHVRQRVTAAQAAPAAEVSLPFTPLPDFTKWGEVQREPMSSLRRTAARRLSEAWITIPHVTNFDKADITELEKMRKRYAKKAEAAGGKLTVTAIILKVAAAGLKVFPKLNASIDMANEEIVYKNYCHIGVAVDTEHGLLVPVIRDVDQKNIVQLSVELSEISEKARSRKVTLDDLEGSTFTVTNLGGIGGTNFGPIINPPNVAILGVARGSIEPVFEDGEFVPRLMLPLSLSYDHRLVDGADAARFLRWLCEALERPFLMALEG